MGCRLHLFAIFLQPDNDLNKKVILTEPILLNFQSKKEKGGGGGGKAVTEMNPWPDYIQERMVLWDRLKKEADESLAAKVSEPIQVRAEMMIFVISYNLVFNYFLSFLENVYNRHCLGKSHFSNVIKKHFYYISWDHNINDFNRSHYLMEQSKMANHGRPPHTK